MYNDINAFKGLIMQIGVTDVTLEHRDLVCFGIGEVRDVIAAHFMSLVEQITNKVYPHETGPAGY